MEIKCGSCDKKIVIPEEKIPSGKSFSLRCPTCKGKINVDGTDQEEKNDLAKFGQELKHEQPKNAPGESGSTNYDATEKPFDFLEEEGLTAMVCENDPAAIQKIREVLDIMDYSVTVPESTRDALRKMKYHLYDLILVNETFDGSDPKANGILIYLERMNMSERRNIFVGLITKQFATRDNMAAFLKSVNITINQKDVLHIDRILKSAINENELFFMVYKESLKKISKI